MQNIDCRRKANSVERAECIAPVILDQFNDTSITGALECLGLTVPPSCLSREQRKPQLILHIVGEPAKILKAGCKPDERP